MDGGAVTAIALALVRDRGGEHVRHAPFDRDMPGLQRRFVGRGSHGLHERPQAPPRRRRPDGRSEEGKCFQAVLQLDKRLAPQIIIFEPLAVLFDAVSNLTPLPGFELL